MRDWMIDLKVGSSVYLSEEKNSLSISFCIFLADVPAILLMGRWELLLVWLWREEKVEGEVEGRSEFKAKVCVSTKS